VWIRENSRLVQEAVISLYEFAEAETVCCYIALPREVQTGLIFDRCWRERKTICVPAFCRDKNGYELTRMKRDALLVKGPAGILEPAETDWILLDEVDLMLVPGVAFDVHGGRLGHGGGHYDRIMGSTRAGTPIDKKVCFKVGLAFEFQMCQRVPMGEADIRMNMVVTEKRVITVGEGVPAQRWGQQTGSGKGKM